MDSVLYPLFKKMNPLIRLLIHAFGLGCFLLIGLTSTQAQISFVNSNLYGEISNNPTSLQFGPDGRLYVAQQDGTIYAYTIVRNGAQNYQVTATEVINLIKEQTPNHNDDGGLNTTQTRQITGLLVVGTAQNPIIYVSSSDWRIAVDNDSNLDTNSGVISRLTKNGSSWDKVDIVRGLPRCEENHSTNGMVLDESTHTLLVMSGGHTNMGAQSASLGMTPEYALSAALLSVDLNAIEAMPIYTDSRTNTQFIYDIPTLDDPTRTNITHADPNFPYPSNHPLYNSSVDLGDPFGGNDGLNQARIVLNGPVQIYSPGYRNAYDVVLTEAGRLYTFDNGPNGGWGGPPVLYNAAGGSQGTGPWQSGFYATNERNETESFTYGDGLHFITGPGYYGGHPNPTRANPSQANVYIHHKTGSNWVLQNTYNFATDFPELPVPHSMANPIESDYREPGNNGSLAIINTSTNGMDEYTASNFQGAMKGQLLAAAFDGNVYRFKLNAEGTQVVQQVAEFSGFGYQPLDVTAQGDADIFPGTVWVAVYGSDNISIFEPSDFATEGGCPEVGTGNYNPNADSDADGYSNGDEVASGTNHCSAGSKPADFDGTLINGYKVSNLNDPDDDDDGILDIQDAFVWDASNGLNTSLPVIYPFINGDPGTGFFGLGFTGLMSNGTSDYLTLFNTDNITAGGAGGNFTIDAVNEGDPYGASNNQQYAFQFGINVHSGSKPFTIHSKLLSPFFNNLTPQNYQNWGIFFGTGDQDNYVKIVFTANNGSGGVEVLYENQGIPQGVVYGPATVGNLLASGAVDLYLSINPSNHTVQPYVSGDEGITKITLGSPITFPASWLSNMDNKGLAVGLISTSVGPGAPFNAKWDFIHVTEDNIVLPPSAAQALFVAKPPFGTIIDGSTYNFGSYAITNESPAGSNIKITSVVINMVTNIVPDVAFDPYGTAGDPVGKDFTPDVGASATGYVSRTFFAPIGNGGYQGLNIDFNGFDPGETFKFSLDADHISIEGLPAPGPGEAGSITGLEMVGSTITVNFSDGTSYTHKLYSDGSDLGSFARLKATIPAAPSIASVGLVAPAVANSSNQTIQVSGGTPNGKISLLQIEGAQFDNNIPLVFAPYEINNVIKINRLINISLDAAGNATIPVTLIKSDPEGGFNYFVAAQEDEANFGYISNVIKLAYDPIFNANTTVTTLTLINADNDQDIVQLQPGTVINLAELPTNVFSIRANTNGGEESVKFALSGAKTVNVTESMPPYAIFGDVTSGSTSNYNGQSFSVGNYNLTATPYSGNGATGTVGIPMTVNFSIVNNQPNMFSLNLSSAGNGTVNVNPVGPYNPGTQLTVSATPNNGYQFSGWANEVGSIVSIANPYVFSINSNVTLTAQFTQINTNNTIISFTLINALTDVDILTLEEGMKIDISTLPTTNLSIRANTGEGDESIKMSLTGVFIRNQTESVEPYALFGDSPKAGGGIDYTGAPFGVGNYTISATPYTGNSGTGTAGATKTVNFSLISNSAPTLSITELILVNATTDQLLGTLNEGAVINLSAYPVGTIFTVLANVGGSVESVKLVLSGAKSKTQIESLAPYGLYGDQGANYYGEAFVAGNYKIVATPYSADGGGGQAGSNFEVNFSVVNALNKPSVAFNNQAIQTEAKVAEVIKVYPNPIRDEEVTLEFSEKLTGTVKYYIFDAQNKLLAEGLVWMHEPSFNLRLNLSNLRLNQGNYYLKIAGKNLKETAIKLQK